MPNITPTWGLTYPCPGEVVGAQAFAQFNQDVEEALAALDAMEEAAANRPAVRMTRPNPAVIAAGGVTTVPMQSVDFVVNWPNPLVQQVPVKGLYEISYQQLAATGFATVTGETVQLTFTTNVSIIGRTWNNINNFTEDMHVCGTVPLNAGEAITASYSPFGTGNFTIPEAALSVHLICRIP